MSKVVHFEIPSDNFEKAKSFYSNVFGWKFQQWGDMPYYMTQSGPKDEMGIEGALTKKSGYNMSVVNTIGVGNLDEIIEVIKANRGEVFEKMPIPTIGWFAYFKDPDGNIQGIMQPDANVK
ncbi:MAG TPA: VOC family protein [Ignavibacteria bacterium]